MPDGSTWEKNLPGSERKSVAAKGAVPTETCRYVLLPRPMSAVFDEAFDLYKQHFFLLALIVATLYIPTQIILHGLETQWLRPLLTRLEDMSDAEAFGPSVEIVLGYLLTGLPQFGIPGLASLMALCMASGPVALTVSRLLQNETLTVWDAYRRSFRHFWRLLIGWVATGLAFLFMASTTLFLYLFGIAAIGMLLTSLPDSAGIVLAVLMFLLPYVAGCALVAQSCLFTTQLIVLEKEAIFRLAGRNAALVSRKRFLRTWLATIYLPLILFGLQFLILGSVYSLIMTFRWSPLLEFLAQTTAASVINFFFQPYGMVFLTLFYYDYRTRREGLDIRQIAEELAMPEPTGPLLTPVSPVSRGAR